VTVGRPCLEAGCPAMAVDGQRCEVHRRRFEAPYREAGYKQVRRAVQAGLCGPCVDCGTFEELTVDHRVAVSRGGGNQLANLVVRCRRCNRRKGAESR
jgi:5-methylcytosine-specific restriction endonuclease McrA